MTYPSRTALVNAGFTLLELLVVLAVIGFLSSISIVALSASQRHSRDTQRQLDQISIMKAVELYVADNGTVPAQLGFAGFRPLAWNGRAALDMPDSSRGGRAVEASASESPFNRIAEYLFPRAKAFHCAGEEAGTGHTIGLKGEDLELPCEQGGGGGGGGGGPVCGNGVVESGEQCDNGAANGSCPATCSTSCTNNNCAQGGPTCGDGICESGENIQSCPSDCNTGGGGGGVPQSCGNGACNAGETPGNCGQDCPNYSMCYVGGEWDLCCLLGGNQCQGTQGQGGYYSVCVGAQCVQRYFLQPPAYTCGGDSDCTPGEGSGSESKIVQDSDPQWLAGLQRYMASIPKDPGHKQDPGGDSAITAKLNSYWASSHPSVVRQHRFCVYVAFEGKDRIWPYNDINDTPTGPLDQRWSVLCLD